MGGVGSASLNGFEMAVPGVTGVAGPLLSCIVDIWATLVICFSGHAPAWSREKARVQRESARISTVTIHTIRVALVIVRWKKRLSGSLASRPRAAATITAEARKNPTVKHSSRRRLLTSVGRRTVKGDCSQTRDRKRRVARERH